MARKKAPKGAQAKSEGEVVLDLGQGLEIRRLKLDDLIEQDINARFMPPQMFERMTSTIKRDARLESLPFCALTDKGVEVVSGHHRTRSARAAGLKDIHVIVDASGLSNDQIKAKQLAHNSISGRDNDDILRQIYRDIQDAEAKLEAFIDVELDDIEVPEVKIDNVQLDVDFRAITVTFLPHEEALFEEVADKLVVAGDKLYLANLEHYDRFVSVLRRVQQEYHIRAMGTVFCRMAEIVENALGDELVMRGAGMVAVHDIIGTPWVSDSAAKALKELADKLRKEGEIK